jgi:hypothetical protein
MLFFGFSDDDEFTRDEFSYFLDCLFRGLMNLTIKTKKEKAPALQGFRMIQTEIDGIVKRVFPEKREWLDRSQF